MNDTIITIFGGTGFLGRATVRQLAKAGYRIRVISRRATAATELKTAGDVGQITLINANLADPKSYEQALTGAHAVINLVGILYESGKQRFARIHAQGSEKLAQAAKKAGVSHFIHVSALGVDKAHGRYAQSKLHGEQAVLNAFAGATILRPSIMFGPDDNFFNQFACMACFAPALPLIGGGKTRFQPVYVGDVASAIEHCLRDRSTRGQTYELGGPHIYSFKEILKFILQHTNKKRTLVPLPFPLASMVGTAGELLPKPPLTRDQVRLLKTDNVVNVGAQGFAHLHLHPTAIDVIVPTYLARYGKKKNAA